MRSSVVCSRDVKVKESEVAQSCPTVCDPMEGNLPAPQSMGFSRQEYWSGLSFPFPGNLPNSRIKTWSPTLQTDALPSKALGKPDSRLGSFQNLRPLSVANVPDFLLG